MNHTKNLAGAPLLTWAVIALSSGTLAACGKKDEAASTEAAPAEAAAAPAAAAEEAPAKAEPSERAVKAATSRLLDVVHTGEAYVAVGERGHIMRSTDGKTWTQSDSPVRSTLTTVFFVDPMHGWAGGHDAAIVATTDGGKTWKLQNWMPELSAPVLAINFLDTQRGIAVGAYGFYRMTTDGGATWTEAENAATADEWHFNGLTRLADGSLLLVGEVGGIAHSKDEGATWTKLESPYEGTFFGALPQGPSGAVVYGLRGSVYVVDNVATAKAANWRKLETGTYQSVLGSTRLADGQMLLVGAAGTIFKGDTNVLQPISNAAGITLSAVVPTADGLLAVGEKGPQLIAQ